MSVATLPSIQENNALELEEDANECLWNDSSYMMDKEGRELVTLLMDGAHGVKQWPYANGAPSPANSWSSRESLSKRSSGASDDTGDLPQIGTAFTRDFYRLVKFESTRSLASISSCSRADENYVTLKQLCEEYKEKVSYADEVCVAAALDMASERCSEMAQRPVDICSVQEEGGASAPAPEALVSRIPRRKVAGKAPPKAPPGTKIPKSKIPQHRAKVSL